MTTTLATCAALAVTAVVAMPIPAGAAEKRADGVRNAEQTDVSAQRRYRRYGYRYGPRYRYGYRYGYRPYYGAPYYAFAVLSAVLPRSGCRHRRRSVRLRLRFRLLVAARPDKKARLRAGPFASGFSLMPVAHVDELARNRRRRRHRR